MPRAVISKPTRQATTEGGITLHNQLDVHLQALSCASRIRAHGYAPLADRILWRPGVDHGSAWDMGDSSILI